MTAHAHRVLTRLEILVLRALMLALAAGTAAIGVSLLTTPYAIPLTIGLWLGAVGMFALGLWGKLPEDDTAGLRHSAN